MNIWEGERAEIFVIPDKDDSIETQNNKHTQTFVFLN